MEPSLRKQFSHCGHDVVLLKFVKALKKAGNNIKESCDEVQEKLSQLQDEQRTLQMEESKVKSDLGQNKEGEVSAPREPKRLMTSKSFGGLGKVFIAEVADREGWRETFDRVDKDKDGFVTVLELRDFLQAEVGAGEKVQEEEFTQIMKDFDGDRDGKLNFEEFLVYRAYTEEQQREHFQHRMKRAINMKTHGGDKELQQRIWINGVPMKNVTAYLRKEIEETKSCLTLPAS